MRPLVPFFLLALPLLAQHSDTALTNPFNAPEDRRRGGEFYRSQCANCHGMDGKGGASGPNLATASLRHAPTEEAMFRVITKGIAGTSMPGFSMNGREIWQIVAYVRSLNVSRSATAARGDAKAGEQLFTALRCATCHTDRAPDLRGIGQRLSDAELQLALLDPSAAVAPEYWIWQATTTSGQTIKGSRLNEDTFSVQILDSTGRLRGLAKTEIERQTLERRSPMPSFRDKLTGRQLQDLLAYLVQ
jgi:putative heme-binding domain-containing protein